MFSLITDILFITISSIVPLIINPFGIDYYYEPKIVIVYFCCCSAILVYLIYKRKKEIPPLQTKETPQKLILIYLILVLSSTIFSVDKERSLFGSAFREEGAIAILCYVIIFIFASNYYKFKKTHIKILAISGFIISIYAVSQYFGYDPIPVDLLRSDYVGQAYSTLGHRNFLGSYLTLLIPILTFAYIYSANIVYLFVSSVAFLAVSCTITRSSWVSVPFYMLVMLIFCVRQKINIKRYVIAALTFTAIFISMNSFNATFHNRAISLKTDVNQTIKNVPDSAGSGRIFIWKRAVTLIADRPILGSGPDTFGNVFMKKFQKDVDKFYPNVYFDKAHNEFLQIAVTTGIPAFIVYILFLFSLLWKSIKAAKNNIFIIPALCSIVGYNVQAFFNISVVGVAPLYYLILGIAVSFTEAK